MEELSWDTRSKFNILLTSEIFLASGVKNLRSFSWDTWSHGLNYLPLLQCIYIFKIFSKGGRESRIHPQVLGSQINRFRFDMNNSLNIPIFIHRIYSINMGTNRILQDYYIDQLSLSLADLQVSTKVHEQSKALQLNSRHSMLQHRSNVCMCLFHLESLYSWI